MVLDVIVALLMPPPRVVCAHGRTNLAELLEYFGVLAIDAIHLTLTVTGVQAATHQQRIIDSVM